MKIISGKFATATAALLLLTFSRLSAQVLTPLVDFTDTNDIHPSNVGLLLSGSTIFGTIFGEFNNGSPKSAGALPGALFKLNTDGTGLTNFYVFSALAQNSLTNSDGANPSGQLVLSGSKLYGTAEFGGLHAKGTIFSVNADGNGFTNLHNFGLTDSDSSGIETNSDGFSPSPGLVLSGDMLYGATGAGGLYGSGIIFAIHTDGSGFTNLYNFSAISPSTGTNSDGEGGKPGLLLSGQTLFGTAIQGGSGAQGTVFAINTNGTGFTNLHNFSALVRMTTPPYTYTNVDGIKPLGSLILIGNTLYGTTSSGGANTNSAGNAGGTIFSIATDGSGFTTLHNFGPSDGVIPSAGLTVYGGTLYGMAQSDGAFADGTVFSLHTDGSDFTVLDAFAPRIVDSLTGVYTNAGGATPSGNILYAGGILYGVTQEGGTNANGLMFALNLGITPPPIQFTATPTNGFTRLAVQFSGPAVDADNNPILSWNWNFGDGPNSTNSTQNPTHTYTNAAIFQPTLICINSLGNTVTSSGPAITANPIPPFQFTAAPTNATPAPVTVHFTSPSKDAASNTFNIWNWNFGDGSTSAVQNPSHIYTNSGTFFPSLTCVNSQNVTIPGVGPSINVPIAIVPNGGFETGNFANWTLSGYTNASRVTKGSQYAHSGTYGAELLAPKSTGLEGFLSQTIPTSLGASYGISLWLDAPFVTSPTDFQIFWNGNVLFDSTNLAGVGWTNILVQSSAAATNSTLQLGYRTGGAGLYFGLDDVIVTQITSGGSAGPDIANITISGSNIVLSGANGSASQTYYVLMGTNLAQPISQWTPVATNTPGADGSFNVTVTNALSPNAIQRFYILQSP